jgi:hypothetical protein
MARATGSGFSSRHDGYSRRAGCWSGPAPGGTGAGIPAGRRVTDDRRQSASASPAGTRPAGLATEGLKPPQPRHLPGREGQQPRPRPGHHRRGDRRRAGRPRGARRRWRPVPSGRPAGPVASGRDGAGRVRTVVPAASPARSSALEAMAVAAQISGSAVVGPKATPAAVGRPARGRPTEPRTAGPARRRTWRERAGRPAASSWRWIAGRLMESDHGPSDGRQCRDRRSDLSAANH